MNVQANTPATVDQWVMRVVGLFVVVSLLLSLVHSPWWLWFTAFVGLNLVQASCSLKSLKVLGLRAYSHLANGC